MISDARYHEPKIPFESCLNQMYTINTKAVFDIMELYSTVCADYGQFNHDVDCGNAKFVNIGQY